MQRPHKGPPESPSTTPNTATPKLCPFRADVRGPAWALPLYERGTLSSLLGSAGPSLVCRVRESTIAQPLGAPTCCHLDTAPPAHQGRLGAALPVSELQSPGPGRDAPWPARPPQPRSHKRPAHSQAGAQTPEPPSPGAPQRVSARPADRTGRAGPGTGGAGAGAGAGGGDEAGPGWGRDLSYGRDESASPAHPAPPRRDAPGIGAAEPAGPPSPAPRALPSLAALPRPVRAPQVAPGSARRPPEPTGSACGARRAGVCGTGSSAWAAGAGPAERAYCRDSAPSTWRSPSSSAAALGVCAGGRCRGRRGRGGASALTIHESRALIGRGRGRGRTRP